ncbi:MAG: type II toxin-antitoxin system Phd/YefM family antitoxin [Caldilineaceae bacterium]|nr:type II toxin-antitoxin system Phd/YefM family antitoxin [Caldilineaceae bacterium]
MPITVSVREAKTYLSRLLNHVGMGEEVIIARAGKPVARLIAFDEKQLGRTPGSARDQVSVSPDFNASLPSEILNAFETSV